MEFQKYGDIFLSRQLALALDVEGIVVQGGGQSFREIGRGNGKRMLDGDRANVVEDRAELVASRRLQQGQLVVGLAARRRERDGVTIEELGLLVLVAIAGDVAEMHETVLTGVEAGGLVGRRQLLHGLPR